MGDKEYKNVECPQEISSVKSLEMNESDDLCGEIKFISKNKDLRRRRIKYIFKGIAFFLVAAASGGISGAYISNKNKEGQSSIRYIQPLLDKSSNNLQNCELPKNSVTRAAEVVSPAVVGISGKSENFSSDITDGTMGSGVIFKSDGYIVTNYHVIKDLPKIMVKLPNSRIFSSRIIGFDRRSDLAVIKIDATNLPAAKFGDSTKVKAGDVAIAIGNPLGEEFAGTVTAGIVSAVNRVIKIPDTETNEITKYKVIQTDAAINAGNSGGALCNEAGEVIGINSLKFGYEMQADGIGFAISINEAIKVIDALMKYGHVSTPYIGILGKTVVSESKSVKGAYVQEVVHGSGAESAGIKPTDIITEMDGVPINKFDDISDIIEKHKIGETVSCKIWRNGKTIDAKVKITELKAQN